MSKTLVRRHWNADATPLRGIPDEAWPGLRAEARYRRPVLPREDQVLLATILDCHDRLILALDVFDDARIGDSCSSIQSGGHGERDRRLVARDLLHRCVLLMREARPCGRKIEVSLREQAS